MIVLLSVGAEHDGDGRSGLVERLCGGGLLQFYRPARAGETEEPLTLHVLFVFGPALM